MPIEYRIIVKRALIYVTLFRSTESISIKNQLFPAEFALNKKKTKKKTKTQKLVSAIGIHNCAHVFFVYLAFDKPVHEMATNSNFNQDMANQLWWPQYGNRNKISRGQATN